MRRALFAIKDTKRLRTNEATRYFRQGCSKGRDKGEGRRLCLCFGLSRGRVESPTIIIGAYSGPGLTIETPMGEVAVVMKALIVGGLASVVTLQQRWARARCLLNTRDQGTQATQTKESAA